MEGSLHRFRLGRPQAPATRAGKRGAETSACIRCRHMKRKCVREEMGCVLCTSAGVQCSFSESEQVLGKRKFEDMATWLSVCLNGTTIPTTPTANGADGTTSSAQSNMEDGGLAGTSDPSKTFAGRQLVDAYFRHIHRSYPFINRSEVIGEVESMMTLPDRFDSISRKLYLVMAI